MYCIVNDLLNILAFPHRKVGCGNKHVNNGEQQQKINGKYKFTFRYSCGSKFADSNLRFWNFN